MSEIDRTIEGVEHLFQTLTGRVPTDGETVHEPIPPEADPARYVEEQLGRLSSLLGDMREVEPVTPAVMVWETKTSYLAIVELPGVTRDAVTVTASAEGLIVEATASASRGAVPAGATLRYRERGFGPRRRRVTLPPDATLERVTARLADGLLVLEAPKATRPRSVEVQ